MVDLATAHSVAFAASLAVAVGLALGWWVLVARRAPALASEPGQVALHRAVVADRIESFARWIATAATVLVVGGAVFDLYAATPTVDSRPLAAEGPDRTEPTRRTHVVVVLPATVMGIAALSAGVLARALVVAPDGPAPGPSD